MARHRVLARAQALCKTMMTARPSLCIRLRGTRGLEIRGFPEGARRALIALAAALAVWGSPPVVAQLADWTTSKGVQLDPLLEKIVESKESDGAVHYDLAPGAIGA